MQLHTAVINPLNSGQHSGNWFFLLLLLLLIGNALSQSTNGFSTTSSSATTFRPKSGVSIAAYDDNDQQQYTLKSDDLLIYNITFFPLIDSVAYYLVGTGPTRLEVRSPFGGGNSAPTMAAALQIINDFVYFNRSNNVDMITVKMDASNWSNITSDLCEESPPTPSSPCPDVIFLGTTEVFVFDPSDSYRFIYSISHFYSFLDRGTSGERQHSFTRRIL